MDCWVSHNGSRRAKQCPMEWVLAVRKRSLVAFDRSQVGPDHTERRSNRASRSTDGSQHHVPQADPLMGLPLVPMTVSRPADTSCLSVAQPRQGRVIPPTMSHRPLTTGDRNPERCVAPGWTITSSFVGPAAPEQQAPTMRLPRHPGRADGHIPPGACLLYTSDAAD